MKQTTPWAVADLKGFTHEQKVEAIMQDISDYRKMVAQWGKFAEERPLYRAEYQQQRDLAKSQLKRAMSELIELKRRDKYAKANTPTM